MKDFFYRSILKYVSEHWDLQQILGAFSDLLYARDIDRVMLKVDEKPNNVLQIQYGVKRIEDDPDDSDITLMFDALLNEIHERKGV